MTPDRGPVTRCRIRGCIVLGHFGAFDGRCPLHRGGEWDDPRPPTVAQKWAADADAGRG